MIQLKKKKIRVKKKTRKKVKMKRKVKMRKKEKTRNMKRKRKLNEIYETLTRHIGSRHIPPIGSETAKVTNQRLHYSVAACTSSTSTWYSTNL